MESIRKLAFILVSISAFVYLVLQTSSGQQWLETSTRLFFTDESLEQQKSRPLLAPDSKNPQHELVNHLEKKIVNLTEHTHVIAKNIDSLKLEFDALTLRYEALAQQDYKAVDNIEGQTANKELLIEPLSLINVALVAKASVEQASAKPSLTNARAGKSRQHQLEQQARLQDVVRRMELTALNALTQ